MIKKLIKKVQGFTPVELVLVVGLGALVAGTLIFMATSPQYMAQRPINVNIKLDGVTASRQVAQMPNRTPGASASQLIGTTCGVGACTTDDDCDGALICNNGQCMNRWFFTVQPGEIVKCGNEEMCVSKPANASFAPDNYRYSVEGATEIIDTPIPMYGGATWRQILSDRVHASLVIHSGYPQFVPTDLSGVYMPNDGHFPGEDLFNSMKNRTYAVEFEVPPSDFEKYILPNASVNSALVKTAWEALGNTGPYVTPEVIRLRGWYIQGDGIEGEKPLFIIQTGNGHPIAGLGGRVKYRKLAALYASEGFDVLLFDKRRHGFSEGFFTPYGEDIFRVLDQLEAGVKSIDPNGVEAKRQLLGAFTAKTKPVVLWGFSQGANLVTRAMALNHSNEAIDGVFNADGTIDYTASKAISAARTGYNFKGVIPLGGLSGSLRNMVPPGWVAWFDVLSAINDFSDRNMYRSVDQWPAVLSIMGTQDIFAPLGAVDIYNKARGFKEIQMYEGDHIEPMMSDQLWDFISSQALKWSKKVVLNDSPWPDNHASTELENEVCASPKITDVGQMTAAGIGLDNSIEKWLRDLDL